MFLTIPFNLKILQKLSQYLSNFFFPNTLFNMTIHTVILVYLFWPLPLIWLFSLYSNTIFLITPFNNDYFHYTLILFFWTLPLIWYSHYTPVLATHFKLNILTISLICLLWTLPLITKLTRWVLLWMQTLFILTKKTF